MIHKTQTIFSIGGCCIILKNYGAAGLEIYREVKNISLARGRIITER